MDGRRFDDLARALAAPLGRRRALLGVGAAGVAAAVRAGVQAGAQERFCQDEGAPCTIGVPCCAGFGCLTSPLNPNVGVCTLGAGATAGADAGFDADRTGSTDPDPNPGQPNGSGGGGNGTRATKTPTVTTGSGTDTGTGTDFGTQTPVATATTTQTGGNNNNGPNNNNRDRTPTATPQAQRNDVKLEARCEGGLDRVRIENRGKGSLTIQRVAGRSLTNAQGDGYRSFDVGRKVKAGQAVTLGFGPGAGSDRVTAQELFGDGEGGSFEIFTSVGEFRVACEDVAPEPTPVPDPIEIRLACGSNPETTRITNAGDSTITIRTIAPLVKPLNNREGRIRIPSELQRLGVGENIVFRTGLCNGSEPSCLISQGPLPESDGTIYANDHDEGVVVVTSNGVYRACCNGGDHCKDKRRR